MKWFKQAIREADARKVGIQRLLAILKVTGFRVAHGMMEKKKPAFAGFFINLKTTYLLNCAAPTQQTQLH